MSGRGAQMYIQISRFCHGCTFLSGWLGGIRSGFDLEPRLLVLPSRSNTVPEGSVTAGGHQIMPSCLPAQGSAHAYFAKCCSKQPACSIRTRRGLFFLSEMCPFYVATHFFRTQKTTAKRLENVRDVGGPVLKRTKRCTPIAYPSHVRMFEENECS